MYDEQESKQIDKQTNAKVNSSVTIWWKESHYINCPIKKMMDIVNNGLYSI